jgi:hypothetical protein
MPGISLAKAPPRLIYHRRALRNELLPRAVTGTSFFTKRHSRSLVSTKTSPFLPFHRERGLRCIPSKLGEFALPTNIECHVMSGYK